MKKEIMNNYKFLKLILVDFKKFMIKKLKKYFKFQFQRKIQQKDMNKIMIFKKLIGFIFPKFKIIQEL